MNGYERVMAMLDGKPVDCLPLMPITMMFAADQYGVPYGQYAADHRTLVAAQLYTAEKFGFDYVSCISDPAREAGDLGAAVRFFPDQPPAIDESNALLSDKSTLLKLKVPDPTAGGRMLDRVQAAALFREKVGGQLAIEGWIEGPCAEAADLRGINTLMTDFYDDPAFVRDLFEFIIEMETAFAKAQIEAGVDIVGMGDAAASLIGPRFYRELVFPYEKRLVDTIHAMGARLRLHICGNTRAILDQMGQLGCDFYDIDFLVPLDEARRKMGPSAVLTGNIEPVGVLRNQSAERVATALAECFRQAGCRYIVAAGCEVPRDTPEVNVFAMRDFARSHRPDGQPEDGS